MSLDTISICLIEDDSSFLWLSAASTGRFCEVLRCMHIMHGNDAMSSTGILD